MEEKLLLQALSSFHFNNFLKMSDLLSQWLAPSITKNVFLLVGSGTATTYNSSDTKLPSKYFNISSNH